MLAFFHPTLTLVVDDDPVFLESFEYRFGAEFPCKTSKSPEEAVRLLQRSDESWKQSAHFIEPLAGTVDGEGVGRGDVLLSARVSALKGIGVRPGRETTISVVVVDYAMPNMTGVELCRRIRHLPIKRILLTGKAGDDTAIAAFNEGLIDQFVMKQDATATAALPSEIKRLQKSFFNSLASPLTPILGHGPTSFYSEPTILQRIQAILNSADAVEYYISVFPPGFRYVTRDGQSAYLIIYDDDTTRAHREIARIAGAPPELIEALESDSKIAFFPTSDGFFNPRFESNWHDYVSNAEIVSGKHQWRIALFSAAPYDNLV